MTGDKTPEQELTNSSDQRNPQHGDLPTAVDGQGDEQADHWASASGSEISGASDLSDEELDAYAADEDDADDGPSGAADSGAGQYAANSNEDDDPEPQFTDEVSPIHLEPTVKMSRPKDFLEFAAVELKGDATPTPQPEAQAPIPEPYRSADRPSGTTTPKPNFTESGDTHADYSAVKDTPEYRPSTPSPEAEASDKSDSGEVVREPQRSSHPRHRRPEQKSGDNRASERGVRRVRPPRPGAGRKAPPVRAELPPALIQTLQSFATRVQNLESNTQKIARALVEIVKEGDNRKKAYDVLYGEMRQYKENFLWQAQKPLFMDLIKLFDSMLRVQRKYEALDEMDEVADDFIYLKEVLLETLYRYDIELIEEHPERLDISIQKPVKRIDCDNPDEDRAVVQYIREGFTRDGMVLRPQEIVVKRYVEGKE